MWRILFTFRSPYAGNTPGLSCISRVAYHAKLNWIEKYHVKRFPCQSSKMVQTEYRRDGRVDSATPSAERQCKVSLTSLERKVPGSILETARLLQRGFHDSLPSRVYDEEHNCSTGPCYPNFSDTQQEVGFERKAVGSGKRRHRRIGNRFFSSDVDENFNFFVKRTKDIQESKLLPSSVHRDTRP